MGKPGPRLSYEEKRELRTKKRATGRYQPSNFPSVDVPGLILPSVNSTALLAAAKRRLDAIDVVLVTERLADAGPVLSRELGWAVTDATAHRAGTNKGDVIQRTGMPSSRPSRATVFTSRNFWM